MPMNSGLTSAVSAKGRTERSNKPSIRTVGKNLIAKVRSWLDNLVSFVFAVPILGRFLRSPVAWVLMTFVIGFAAGIAWQPYGGTARKGGASSERFKAMSLSLAAARQNLDKVANEMSRLEAQGMDVPRRRAAR
jgi:hypothetical protein